MRVAFLIDTIVNWEAGTEQQLSKLLTVLDRKRFEPELYLLMPSRDLTAKDFPCPVHVVRERPGAGRSRLSILSRLTRLLRQQRPHIVQTHFPGATYYGTIAARIAAVPVVVSCRRDTGFWQEARDRIILWVINRLVDSWQCNSKAVFESLRTAENVPAERIEILPNAIDLTLFRPPTPEERLAARRQLALSPDAPVCVSVANLKPVKDPETLLAAARSVRETLPTAQFLLVGDGPLQTSLATAI